MLNKLTKKVETAQRLYKKRFRNCLTSLLRCQTSPIFFSYPASLFCGSLITYIKQLKKGKYKMPKEEACFIEQLYEAIEKQRSAIVDWDPNGKGFIVGNLGQFTNKILSRQFNIGRLDSFARKLNRHGFKRSKIDKNKIRFFHKYFNRQSKNLHKIKKLSRQESLPKHIKLKIIREQIINNKNGTTITPYSDIVNQIYQNVQVSDADLQLHEPAPPTLNINNPNSTSATSPSQPKLPATSTNLQNDYYCPTKPNKGSTYFQSSLGHIGGPIQFHDGCSQNYHEDENDDDNQNDYLNHHMSSKYNDKVGRGHGRQHGDEVKIEGFLSTPKSVRFDFRSDNEDQKLEQECIEKGISQFLEDSQCFQR